MTSEKENRELLARIQKRETLTRIHATNEIARLLVKVGYDEQLVQRVLISPLMKTVDRWLKEKK